MAPDQNPEEDELVPLTVVDVLEDGTVVAERMTEEEVLTMTTPVEPGSPAPLRTIDQREQDEKNRIASAKYNHTSGLRHTFKHDGTTYDVDRNGAWHRVTPRHCAESHNLKNHGVARRARRGVV
jgi:hypothetical protein